MFITSLLIVCCYLNLLVEFGHVGPFSPLLEQLDLVAQVLLVRVTLDDNFQLFVSLSLFGGKRRSSLKYLLSLCQVLGQITKAVEKKVFPKGFIGLIMQVVLC